MSVDFLDERMVNSTTFKFMNEDYLDGAQKTNKKSKKGQR